MKEERLVIAIDASDASERAVRYAARHLARGDDRVCLLAVLAELPVSLIEFAGAATPGKARRVHAEDEQRLAQWREGVLREAQPLFERLHGLLVEAGVDAGRIETECYLPNPGERVPDAILHALHQRRADTVVVGRNPGGFLRDVLHRHVSDQLVAKSGLNVWVVH